MVKNIFLGWLDCLSLLKWIFSCTVSIAKTTSTNPAFFYTIFFSEAVLYLFKCSIQTAALTCFLDMLDKVQKWVRRTGCLTLAVSLKPFTHFQNLPNLTRCCRTFANLHTSRALVPYLLYMSSCATCLQALKAYLSCVPSYQLCSHTILVLRALQTLRTQGALYMPHHVLYMPYMNCHIWIMVTAGFWAIPQLRTQSNLLSQSIIVI